MQKINRATSLKEQQQVTSVVDTVGSIVYVTRATHTSALHCVTYSILCVALKVICAVLVTCVIFTLCLYCEDKTN